MQTKIYKGRQVLLATIAGISVVACAPSGGQLGPYSPPPTPQMRMDMAPNHMIRANHGPMNPDTTYMFQQWIDYEPQYLLYPGDQLDIVVHSAPELSRTLTVGPDGRIVMPMARPVMAAGRSMEQLERRLEKELSTQLRDPKLDITPRAYGPQRVFVGGQVGQQGTYELPGPIGVLEAVTMAGGFLPSSKRREVAVLRRAPNGGLMIRVVNLKSGMRDPYLFNDTIQLRRHDVVFVPRSEISEVNLFIQQYIRDALPVDFSASYNLGDGFNNN